MMLPALALAAHTYLLRSLCATSKHSTEYEMTVTYKGKPTPLSLHGKYAGTICTATYSDVTVKHIDKVDVKIKVLAVDGPLDEQAPSWSLEVDPIGDAP